MTWPIYFKDDIVTWPLYIKDDISNALHPAEVKCPVSTLMANGCSNYLADLAIICGRHAVNKVWHSIPSRPVLNHSTPLCVPGLSLIDLQCPSVAKQTKRKLGRVIFRWSYTSNIYKCMGMYKEMHPIIFLGMQLPIHAITSTGFHKLKLGYG